MTHDLPLDEVPAEEDFGPGRSLTAPPRPMPSRPSSRGWLPIVLAAVVGLAAIAAAAKWGTG